MFHAVKYIVGRVSGAQLLPGLLLSASTGRYAAAHGIQPLDELHVREEAIPHVAFARNNSHGMEFGLLLGLLATTSPTTRLPSWASQVGPP